MENLYQAYQAYERKVERGEFNTRHRQKMDVHATSHEPVLSKLGDLLIRVGFKLKHRSVAGKPMAWSPLTGSKS